MINLRDQLLKAGLIDKKAKHQADREARKKKKQKKKEPTEMEKQAERYRQELEARRKADRQREAQRLQKNRKEENRRRLISLIDGNQVEPRPGRRAFYFRGEAQKVGCFHLSSRQAEALEEGELAIVRHPNDPDSPYRLLPERTLNELRSIDPDAIVFDATA